MKNVWRPSIRGRLTQGGYGGRNYRPDAFAAKNEQWTLMLEFDQASPESTPDNIRVVGNIIFGRGGLTTLLLAE